MGSRRRARLSPKDRRRPSTAAACLAAAGALAAAAAASRGAAFADAPAPTRREPRARARYRPQPPQDAAGVPQPVFSAPLRRLELDQSQLVGAGYDLVDVRVLTDSGDLRVSTFMLDSGLSTNLLSEPLASELGLKLEDVVEGSALGGIRAVKSTSLYGIQVLGPSSDTEERFEAVWEGDGWRALCSLDWNGFVAKAREAGGKVSDGQVVWTVLPTPDMTEKQVTDFVGFTGTELVGGNMGETGSVFFGKGVSVEPKGFLATTDRYELTRDGGDVLMRTEAVDELRLRPAPLRETLPVPGPVPAVCAPFTQAELAERQGVKLEGMLGQYPFHRLTMLDIDPIEGKLSVYQRAAGPKVAAASGLSRVPGEDLEGGLFSVSLVHAPLLGKGSASQAASEPVQALVDSGSANTILNWPAAEKILGIRQGDRIVKDAPLIRVVGVGGGSVDMPLLTLSIGLRTEELLPGADDAPGLALPKPVRVAIGDADVFEDIFGREEQGSWFGGLGPRELKPAALIGQDILSQSRYLLAAAEPALYMRERPTGAPAREEGLQFVGDGDCLDAEGRRLQGLQKLATTPDDAAITCLELGREVCRGVAVTPLTESRFQGLCYIFVEAGSAAELDLEANGWVRYTAPAGQSLAPAGVAVASANGDGGAECYSW